MSFPASAPDRGVRGVNTVLLRDGCEIHLDDIATAAQGQTILDEIDGAILSIEDQFTHSVSRPDDPTWRQRAEIALKRKRRSRAALQRRIGELRRAEKQAAVVHEPDRPNSAKDGRRRAFVLAAEQMLDREVFGDLARAAELRPTAFGVGDPSP